MKTMRQIFFSPNQFVIHKSNKYRVNSDLHVYNCDYTPARRVTVKLDVRALSNGHKPKPVERTTLKFNTDVNASFQES